MELDQLLFIEYELDDEERSCSNCALNQTGNFSHICSVASCQATSRNDKKNGYYVIKQHDAPPRTEP